MPDDTTRIAESIQCVRGEFRYFAVYATPYGAVQVVFSRSDENGKDNSPDASFGAYVFRPDWVTGATRDAWRFVASLLYGEIEGRDVPKHSDEPQKFLELLRDDGLVLLARVLAVLECESERHERERAINA